MLSKALVAAALATHVTAFPFVALSVGMDPEEMKRADRLVERTPGDGKSKGWKEYVRHAGSYGLIPLRVDSRLMPLQP